MKKTAVFIIALLTLLTLAAPGQAGERGKLYVIGLGPAGPATATLQALNTIEKMDALVTRARHLKPFAKYIGDTPVWFDHLSGLWDYQGKFFTKLGPTDLKKFKAHRAKLTAQRLKRINAFLAQGRNLGMLEGGNPCVFSSSHWYLERMDPKDVVIIPGMGSAAAAMAALGKSAIPAHGEHFLLQSAPFKMIQDASRDKGIYRDLAKYDPTMIYYMALKNPEPFFARLREAFDPDTPCAVVFWAGDPQKQRVTYGTLADMPAKLAPEKERYMGILLVGNFLRGKPYLSAEDKP